MVTQSIIAEWLKQFRQREDFQPMGDKELSAFIVEQIICNKHDALSLAMPYILEQLGGSERFCSEVAGDLQRTNEHYNGMNRIIEERESAGGLLGLNKMVMLHTNTSFVGVTFYASMISVVIEWVESEFSTIRGLANLQFGAKA